MLLSKLTIVDLPNKVLAVRTECWLLEEAGYEAMILDIEDVLLLQGSFA